MIKVKNLKGTSDRIPTCKCKTWLEHWQVNYGYSSNGYCECCNNFVGTHNLVGGHVKKVGSYDMNQYIVPICYSCNNQEDKEFYVDEDKLVSANCNYCKNR